MTYRDIFLCLIVASSSVLLLHVLGFLRLKQKMKRQVTYATILKKMSMLRYVYVRAQMLNKFDKYPNIEKTIQNTVQSLDKLIEAEDYEYRGIEIRKGINPTIDSQQLVDEMLKCPQELSKILASNAEITMLITKLKRPFLYYKTTVTMRVFVLIVRILCCFPNRHNKQSKAERHMAESLKREVVTVGIQ